MKNIAPVAALIFSICVFAFLAGTFTTHYEVFPYPNIRDAGRTLKALLGSEEDTENPYLHSFIGPVSDIEGNVTESRWTSLDDSALDFPVIAYGGHDQYLEICPDQGCLAVAFDEQQKVIQSWPYRPDAIYEADITDGAYPHEMLSFDPKKNTRPVSIQHYPNGDLLVNFQSRGETIFPFGMGVSRVKPDGTPRWTRFDYSHHWSTLNEDGTAFVPSLKIGEKDLQFRYGTEPFTLNKTLDCETDKPQLDIVQIIDGDGKLIEEIDLIPLFLDSSWTAYLAETTDACDPLHLNYVDRIGDDAGPGLTPGDLVLSLRNLSRFAILDSKTRQIKRLVASGFIQQHSVHHLGGSRFLIFDNRGGDAFGPPSRVVELDIATGVERRVFPNAETPQEYASVFSDRAGHLEISPDRRRVMASFTYAGIAFEIDIESGRLLAVYRNIHDISSVEDIPEEERQSIGLFRIYGVGYLQSSAGLEPAYTASDR